MRSMMFILLFASLVSLGLGACSTDSPKVIYLDANLDYDRNTKMNEFGTPSQNTGHLAVFADKWWLRISRYTLDGPVPFESNWIWFSSSVPVEKPTASIPLHIGGVVMLIISGTTLAYPWIRGYGIRFRRSRQNLCLSCGYSRVGAVSAECPECGKPWK